MSSTDLSVRRARLDDAPRLTELSAQLGYEVSQEQLRSQLEIAQQKPDNIILVAELAGKVVGWVHCYIRHLLTDPVNMELGGLVVDEECRSQGVGAMLVQHAEVWAREMGAQAIFVRSNIKRERAHQFYLRNGYMILKTQYTFHKFLNGD